LPVRAVINHNVVLVRPGSYEGYNPYRIATSGYDVRPRVLYVYVEAATTTTTTTAASRGFPAAKSQT